jgi:lysozyme
MLKPVVIDLSHHNANVDFARIRADGVAGVIHKATQGTGFVDKKYAPRRPDAEAAGLLWGAYHFGTGDDVDAQVSHFLDTVKPDGSFVLVLDFEKNTTPPMNSMSLDQAKDFLTAIEQQTGQQPVLYTGSFLTDSSGSAAIPDIAQYRVWWARYSNAPHLHATWPNFWLWQYSDGRNGQQQNEVDGVGPCDCNTFDGDETALRNSWVG